jgi:hypothetical protein
MYVVRVRVRALLGREWGCPETDVHVDDTCLDIHHVACLACPVNPVRAAPVYGLMECAKSQTKSALRSYICLRLSFRLFYLIRAVYSECISI